MDSSSDYIKHDAMNTKSTVQLLAIFAVLLANSALLNSINAILAPALVARLYEGSSTVLGVVTGLGSFFQVSGVVCALLSDRVEFKSGRRRPFIFLGSSFMVIGTVLWLLIEFLDVSLFILRSLFISGFFVAAAGLSITQMLNVSLLVDIISIDQRGRASSVVSLYQVVGSGIGFVLFAADVDLEWIYIVFLMTTIIATIFTLSASKETPFKREEGKPLKLGSIISDLKFNVSDNWNFVLISFVRLLFFAAFGIQSYLQFFLRDVLDQENAVVSMSWVAIAMLSCSFVIAGPVGKLCDKHTKTIFMQIGFATRITALVLLIFVNEFWQMMIVAVFLSFAHINYSTAENALVISYLPSQKQAGAYISLFGLLVVIGVSLGSMIYGLILDFFPDGQSVPGMPQQYTRNGYHLCWIVSISFLAMASFCASRLKKSQSVSPANIKDSV
ncbi:hypothetical protein P9112_007832 [Eukaryota sp. TZLM1-RC]